MDLNKIAVPPCSQQHYAQLSSYRNKLLVHWQVNGSQCGVYTQWRIYYSVKKKDVLPFVTIKMDLESITLNEISQTKKDKCCCDLAYMWNLKKPNL